MDINKAKLKAADYCSYQERSQQQVRDKLYALGLHMDDVEDIISQLITENFINEERFAMAYVRGKFRMKKWGKHKILNGLKQHSISDYCIKKGLAEIEDESYLQTASDIIEKKRSTLQGDAPSVVTQKILNYMRQKGYETELIWNLI